MPFWFGGMFHGPFANYWINGEESSLDQMMYGILHSWFESMSGFTTTGASLVDQSTSPVCSGEFERDCLGKSEEEPHTMEVNLSVDWRNGSNYVGSSDFL